MSNLLLLGYFKYMNFFIDNLNFVFNTEIDLLNIALPLGISFFTFQQIAYLFDSYKDKSGKHTLIDYSLFVIFFPQLVAGPIVHWREMMPQFIDMEKTKFNIDNFQKGLNIFLLGFFKKVLIADNLAILVDDIFNDPTTLDMANSWVGGIAFMLQIYFDFSAYSEMAIGAALMMNIKLPINFNSPYKARNINDFWNKWHITLTRWFFQYTFLPLIAFWSQKSRSATGVHLSAICCVTLIIFILSGLWHGAAWTFVIWGGMHGLALVIYRLWEASKLSMHRYTAHFCTTFFLILVAIIFRANSMEFLSHYAYAMVGGYGVLNANSFVSSNILIVSLFMLIPTYITFCMPNVFEIVGYNNIEKQNSTHHIAPLISLNTAHFRLNTNILVSIAYAIIFSFTLIKVMTADSPEAFIYFDF